MEVKANALIEEPERMLRNLYSVLHCLVGLLVRVSLARRSLRAQFVVFGMKCGDEESHET